MNKILVTGVALSAVAVAALRAAPAPAGPAIIAIGTINGLYEDFAKDTAAPLESGKPGNRLGGIGSGLTHLWGDYFLGVPDRGPNADDYDDCSDALDNTTTFINRFHTLHLSLSPSDAGSKLPFTLTPMLVGTTLLSSHQPLIYGKGCGVAKDGAPALNRADHTFYFTGRSDGFSATHNSGFAADARFDPESIRVSNDRRFVYMSDEYGPFVYQFDRRTGERTKVFSVPVKFFATNLNSHGDTEISGNTVGRVANKGMEGLAITPDGRTLVGAMQSPLAQDGGDVKGGVTRILTIDIESGKTHEYAYQLDTSVKTTISDILAINDHEFLVDERDSKGRADTAGSKAGFKKIFRIDLQFAHDISDLSGQTNIAGWAVPKTLFLDVVAVLTSDPVDMDPTEIPAKLEGISFGQDVFVGGALKHTFYIANDNDFLASFAGLDNPNQFFVFAFDDHDLPFYVPQPFKQGGDDDDHHDRGQRGNDDGDRGDHRR
ncbi:MAG TPA: esterase-like activity of phytase family protein [Vicinamibacterales bacterium]